MNITPGLVGAFKGYGRGRAKTPQNGGKKYVSVTMDLAPGTVITPPGGQPYTVGENDVLCLSLFQSDKKDREGNYHPEWADFDVRLSGYQKQVPQNGGQGQDYAQYAQGYAPQQGNSVPPQGFANPPQDFNWPGE